MVTLALKRPAIVDATEALDAEYRSARWLHHRLLDFEDEHQRLLDCVANECAPGVVRVGRIVARLLRRSKRRARASIGTWTPDPRPALLVSLKARLDELREQRNADPRWREACRWADTPADDAPVRGEARRKASETDEDFAKRCEKRRDRLTRREAYRHALYEQRRCYWGTYNALCKCVDQARVSVIKARKAGLPAEWRRPRFPQSPQSIWADKGFRIVERGKLWWTLEMPLGVKPIQWVRFRAKCGNWHAIPEDAHLRMVQLRRERDGHRWRYSVSIVIAGIPERRHNGSGVVGLDWGHREHGHGLEREGIRAFTWIGDDGASGEILIPRECRDQLDRIDELKARADDAFNARGLPDRNRYSYRRRLMGLGVRTHEESLWLQWEMRYERRMASARKRWQALRQGVYLSAVRQLRQRYAVFAFEDETGRGHRKLDTEEQTRHRKRSNRDLTARYEFLQICERSGARVITVPARNSTRECPEPECGGLLPENGPELLVACPKCGRVRDKDYGAARVILRRALEALATEAQSA